jgi:hypothetical protein
MTQEEYRVLDNHNYSIYTGEMGKIFNDWQNDIIDGNKAAQDMKKWYIKGAKKLEIEKYADIKQNELKRCFDSLDSYIRDHDLVDDDDDYEKLLFIMHLKREAPKSYEAIKRAIYHSIVVVERGSLNFKCARGCVGLIFFEAGYTAYKSINPYILINGKPPAKSTLQNGIKNTPPKQWEHIKKLLFPE